MRGGGNRHCWKRCWCAATRVRDGSENEFGARIWLRVGVAAAGPCSPGVRHGSCSGEMREQDGKYSECGGLSHLWTGIAFEGVIRREIMEQCTICLFRFDSESELLGQARQIGAFALSALPDRHFLIRKKNSILIVIIAHSGPGPPTCPIDEILRYPTLAYHLIQTRTLLPRWWSSSPQPSF
jgi:hypothetical protein